MTTEHLDPNCAFCKILTKVVDAPIVFENHHALTFLDHRPLFPGHCLIIPKSHLQTIQDLPDDLLSPLFTLARQLAAAMELALAAEGAFIAANNRVSQSVPHFHVHVVPRRKGDGLKGFFWPRRKYKDAQEIAAVLESLRSGIAKVQNSRNP